MRSTHIHSALAIALLIGALGIEAKPQSVENKHHWLRLDDYSFPVWLAANHYVNGPSQGQRREVFLYVEAKDFAQSNILDIVSRFEKQYSKPNWLNITIFSDDAQLNRAINEPHIYIEFTDTPLGRKRAFDWYQEYYPLPSGYYRANYVRIWWGEELEFSPKPDNPETVTLFLNCNAAGRRAATSSSHKCWRR
ncbi:MAG: hypothetical protein QOE77_1774 [Blastocatellia bacterium]|nr:hypothetical protein [Blastocatellia bacterium]